MSLHFFFSCSFSEPVSLQRLHLVQHCQRLAPDYAAAAGKAPEGVKFARVDCTTETGFFRFSFLFLDFSDLIFSRFQECVMNKTFLDTRRSSGEPRRGKEREREKQTETKQNNTDWRRERERERQGEGKKERQTDRLRVRERESWDSCKKCKSQSFSLVRKRERARERERNVLTTKSAAKFIC